MALPEEGCCKLAVSSCLWKVAKFPVISSGVQNDCIYIYIYIILIDNGSYKVFLEGL